MRPAPALATSRPRPPFAPHACSPTSPPPMVLQVLERSEARGVTPSLSAFNMILLSLRREGREDEAAQLHAHMLGKGLVADAHTRAVLARPGAELSRQRTAQLHRLLAAGDEEEALALYNGLVERGHADRYQLAVMRPLMRAASSSGGDGSDGGAGGGRAARVNGAAYEVASDEY